MFSGQNGYPLWELDLCSQKHRGPSGLPGKPVLAVPKPLDTGVLVSGFLGKEKGFYCGERSTSVRKGRKDMSGPRAAAPFPPEQVYACCFLLTGKHAGLVRAPDWLTQQSIYRTDPRHRPQPLENSPQRHHQPLEEGARWRQGLKLDH